MSVIQEALRRKQDEEAARPQPPVPPPAPAHIAPPPALPPEDRTRRPPRPDPVVRRRRRGRRILVLGIVAVLLLGAAVPILWHFAAWRSGFRAMGPAAVGRTGDGGEEKASHRTEGEAWPRIRLGSLARSSAGLSSAILNGRLVGVGEEIEGVTLVEVAANGVTLERGDDRRFVHVGEQTP